MFSERRCAVTITSVSSLEGAALSASPAAANTRDVAGALRIAATAAEIFGFAFISLPRTLVVNSPRPTASGARGQPPSIPSIPFARGVLEETRHPCGMQPLHAA